MADKTPSQYILELAEKYFEQGNSVTDKELELLCMFHEKVQDYVSQQWAEYLNVTTCNHFGSHLEIKSISSMDEAKRLKDQLVVKGFTNTRIYIDPMSVSHYIVEGRKESWFKSPTKQGEGLYKQIEDNTSVRPLFVHWFNGEIIVDINANDDVEAVQAFLEKKVRYRHQELLRGHDERLSIEVVRFKIIDTLAPKHLKA